jgi:glutamate-1-semialdehyde aminotransferase|tara:strand:+ start:7674 stop:8954 length:1281 start_codon:yes stop_codon:yes gene_type:complete
MNQLKNSKKLLKKAKKLIPGLSQTFSKAPYSYVEGVYPTYLSHGKGSHVYDVDNNEYIDYVLALGPIILGYNYAAVNNSIKKQLSKGISFSIPHYLEVETSEKIKSIIPGTDMVRFSKTGSDAGTGAIRAARAYTKKNNIAYCGGGGVWHDWYTVTTSRNEGIPNILNSMIKKFEYNSLESLKIIFEEWKNEVAAIYMEPMILEYPKKDFLTDVKKLSKKHGSILIFDEVLTGFRMANGGAQEYFGVQSDLAVFGKGIANGMPLGAITGKEFIMEKFNDIFYSTTYGGETLSLAAANAVIDTLIEKPVIKKIWKMGKYFISRFNEISEKLNLSITIEGIPCRSKIFCNINDTLSLSLQSLFYQECIKRGVLFGPGNVLLSYSHSFNDLEKTLIVVEKSMKICKKAIQENNVESFLNGSIMKPVIKY